MRAAQQGADHEENQRLLVGPVGHRDQALCGSFTSRATSRSTRARESSRCSTLARARRGSTIAMARSGLFL
jgi:hypothetical protein